MKLKDFSKIYFAIVLLNLAVIYRADTGVLYYLSKPLLMFCLIAYFSGVVGKFPAKLWVTGALIFSLLGDILLLFEGEVYLLAGMLVFGLAHLMYATFFYLRSRAGWHPGILATLPIIALSFYLLNFEIRPPDDLILPVNIYAILLMLSFTLGNNYHFSRKLPLYTLNAGLILFVLSDMALAYQIFQSPAAWLQMLVIFSYAMAQFCIVWGISRGEGGSLE